MSIRTYAQDGVTFIVTIDEIVEEGLEREKHMKVMIENIGDPDEKLNHLVGEVTIRKTPDE